MDILKIELVTCEIEVKKAVNNDNITTAATTTTIVNYIYIYIYIYICVKSSFLTIVGSPVFFSCLCLFLCLCFDVHKIFKKTMKMIFVMVAIY